MAPSERKRQGSVGDLVLNAGRPVLSEPAVIGLNHERHVSDLPVLVPPDDHEREENDAYHNKRNTQRQVLSRSISITRGSYQEPQYDNDQSAKFLEQ